jgi:uncharacterized membrane protein
MEKITVVFKNLNYDINISKIKLNCPILLSKINKINKDTNQLKIMYPEWISNNYSSLINYLENGEITNLTLR